mmetsp:Transcript_10408/g.13667  ORF Transcript_10408/g.13667 Transcript_10408/m.13667 type:complete len:205 (+) Transcript_10408:239-853(+)
MRNVANSPFPPFSKVLFASVLLMLGTGIFFTKKTNTVDGSVPSSPNLLLEGKQTNDLESLMVEKENGSCRRPPQATLRFSASREIADRICCFNRHYAERSGYFLATTWVEESMDSSSFRFYDSVTGKLLFHGPVSREFSDLVAESEQHGWPSFRDDEVEWRNVKVLPNGEVVSIDGTHLGHNLPDSSGNRYCINLVCISGQPNA